MLIAININEISETTREEGFFIPSVPRLESDRRSISNVFWKAFRVLKLIDDNQGVLMHELLIINVVFKLQGSTCNHNLKL